MNLEEIKQIISGSDINDWSIIYLENNLITAIYKPNVAITLTFGRSIKNDKKIGWVKDIFEENCSTHFAEVFYNNALVLSETYIEVDGMSCILPHPILAEDNSLYVSDAYYRFIRLLEELCSGTDSDVNFIHYFNRTGIKVIEMSW
jgi:hypothetical protein